MSKWFRHCAFAFVPAATALFAAAPAHAAWQEGVNYGGSTIMHLYVPTKVDASPGIVVALHYCGGNAGNAHPWFQSLSDMYGFIVIAPGAGGNCFDATPARSGERDAITKMVSYVVSKNNADPKKVFAAGASSGACMTQALLAAYPDVFAGGSVLAGVPAGAWTGGNAYGWSTPSKTAEQWGDIVRNADKGFTGTRPRLQLWHGTGDTTLTYSQNFPAEVLQWTNVLGVSDANATKSSFKAQDTWARTSYKDASGTVVLETDVAEGVPHDLSGRGLWPDVVRFFGLDMDSPGTGGGTGGTGGTGAGGASASAGSSSGGVSNSAGAANSGGGSTSVAGSTAVAGSTGVAGSSNVAGAPSGAAGSSAVGGTSSGSAGAGTAGTKPAAGGSSAAGSGSSSDDGGGCSVSSGRGAGQSRGALVGLLVAGLAAVVRRRRSAA